MQFTREINRAFDLWLNRSLMAQYGATLREDVPKELLALLGEATSRAGVAAGAASADAARDCVGHC